MGRFWNCVPEVLAFFPKIDFLDELHYLADLMSTWKEHIMTHRWIKAKMVGSFDKRNQFNLIKCLGTSLFRLSRHFPILLVAFKRNHLSSYLMRVVLSAWLPYLAKLPWLSDIQIYTSLRWDEKLFSHESIILERKENFEYIRNPNWYFHSLKWFNFLLRGASDANVDTMGQFIIRMQSGCILKCNNLRCFCSSAFCDAFRRAT